MPSRNDAKELAREDGEDWSSLSLAERLSRLDTDEGHSIYERYFGEHDPRNPASAAPHWSVALVRTWLSWGLGIEVTREVWRPNRLHIMASFGPFALCLTREWGKPR